MAEIALASRHMRLSKLDTARTECCVHNLTWQVLCLRNSFVAFACNATGVLLDWGCITFIRIVTPKPGSLSLFKYPY